jgi:hypothetical protein
MGMLRFNKLWHFQMRIYVTSDPFFWHSVDAHNLFTENIISTFFEQVWYIWAEDKQGELLLHISSRKIAGKLDGLYYMLIYTLLSGSWWIKSMGSSHGNLFLLFRDEEVWWWSDTFWGTLTHKGLWLMHSLYHVTFKKN